MTPSDDDNTPPRCSNTCELVYELHHRQTLFCSRAIDRSMIESSKWTDHQNKKEPFSPQLAPAIRHGTNLMVCRGTRNEAIAFTLSLREEAFKVRSGGEQGKQEGFERRRCKNILVWFGMRCGYPYARSPCYLMLATLTSHKRLQSEKDRRKQGKMETEKTDLYLHFVRHVLATFHGPHKVKLRVVKGLVQRVSYSE
jgi:hypothetical protein